MRPALREEQSGFSFGTIRSPFGSRFSPTGTRTADRQRHLRASDAIRCYSLINSLLRVCAGRFPDFSGSRCRRATDAFWFIAATNFSRTVKVAANLEKPPRSATPIVALGTCSEAHAGLHARRWT